MSTLALGIDMARATFVAAMWHDGAGHLLGQFANTPAGFAQLRAAVQPWQSAEGTLPHLVVEPTGGYEQALVAFGYAAGWQVSLPNPKQVRDWAKGTGRRAKTDQQDALLLAHYAAERQPPAQQPVPEEVSELDSLLKRREDVEQMLRQERNRLETLSQRPHIHDAVLDSLRQVLEALEQQQQAVEEAIAQHLKAQASLAEETKRLRSVPGVGAKNVLPLLVVFHRWDALTGGTGDAKGLTAFVGLDPMPYSSGTRVYKRPGISRMGDRRVRRLLSMGALGGVRGHNPLRPFYQRLVGRGKKKKLALVAAARKILTWAFAIFRSGEFFASSRYPLSEVAAN